MKKVPHAFSGFLAMLTPFLLANSLLAQLPLAELTTIYPPGGKQGSTIDVQIRGANLDDANQLQFSHDGIVGKVKMATAEFQKTARPVASQFEVKIAGDVPPGIYEVRSVGRYGTSNPRAFVVGVYEEVADSGANKSADKAQEVKIGSTVNGRVDANSVDYYKLALQAGQRVLIECIAERIDSRMNATLVVANSDGSELQRNLDYEGADPLVDFTAPADGEYVISVYDFIYRGGADYAYRLTVHTDPHVDFVFPPSGAAGSNGQYTVFGRNLPGGKPVPEMTINGVPLEATTVNISLPDGTESRRPAFVDYVATQSSFLDKQAYRFQKARAVPIYIARAPVAIENEPNDDPSKATVVAIPCELAGQFYPARDVDWIQFEAKKGDVYFLEVISHQMGLDTDPIMLLQRVVKKDDGTEQVSDIASVDDPADRAAKIGTDFDTTTDDPSYRFTAPDDGIYRVMLRDQFGDSRNDARMTYRLAIQPESPDFRVLLVPDQQRPGNRNANQVFMDTPVIYRGGSTTMMVRVDRRNGFDGEIEVTVDGLPKGVTCPGAIIGASADNGWLVFNAATDAPAWSGPIEVSAKGNVDGNEIVRYARTGTTVWGTTNRTTLLPDFRMTRNIVLSVSDKLAVPAEVAIGDGQVVETCRGAKFEVPVKIVRHGDFKADLKVSAVGMPAEIKPGDVTVKGADGEGKIAFAITNARAAAGSYTFFWKSDVKTKMTLNPDAVAAAEAEQKEVEEAIESLADQIKQATTAKDAAVKAAQEAASALKTAQSEKKSEDEIKKSQEAVTAAQADQKKAEEQLKQLQEAQKRATAAKTAAAKKVADLKKSTAAKDINVALVSTPIRLRIYEAPQVLSLAAEQITVKQGEKAEFSVSLAKRFGFDEKVSITLEAPKGVAGISGKATEIDKGKTEAKIEVSASNNATVGEHEFVVRARSKFNNVQVDDTKVILIKVDKADQ